MLYFVGVGPGDPELISMKAARILQEADAIAIPDSGRDSVVWKIAGQWMEGKALCRLPMPMKGSRGDWEDAHRQAVEILLEWLKQYESIAYPVLGDPGIYASSSYLMKRIAPYHPCKLIPGIPALCAAAAELGIPLCEQGEPLTVIDRFEEKLPDGNAVVMKGGRSLDRIKQAAAGREAYAVCNLGMENMCLGKLDESLTIPPSYFTTVLIRACKHSIGFAGQAKE